MFCLDLIIVYCDLCIEEIFVVCSWSNVLLHQFFVLFLYLTSVFHCCTVLFSLSGVNLIVELPEYTILVRSVGPSVRHRSILLVTISCCGNLESVVKVWLALYCAKIVCINSALAWF